MGCGVKKACSGFARLEMYAAGMVVELMLINRRGGGFGLTLSGVRFYLSIDTME